MRLAPTAHAAVEGEFTQTAAAAAMTASAEAAAGWDGCSLLPMQPMVSPACTCALKAYECLVESSSGSSSSSQYSQQQQQQ
jgi:hypothetical protein